MHGVGTNGQIDITLKSYEQEVRCHPEPGYEDHGRCAKVLGVLPVSWGALTFKRNSTPGDRSVKVGSGKKWTDAHDTCTALLTLDDHEDDKCSYWDIWAAAVAVDRLCVKKGMAGEAHGLGKSGRLKIALGP